MANDVRRIDPSNLDVHARDDGTFTLEFSTWSDGRSRTFKIDLNDWWIPLIVDHLRDVAKKRAAEAQKLLDAFGSGR